jgi:phage replication-related protein YjqB (UPF0714/DUF867 family)
MPDKYASFADLAADHEEGVHYRIRLVDRASSVVMAAPHGGRIEPGTELIAQAIAGDQQSFYAFEGLTPSAFQRLHLTSTRFDEPRCLQIIESHQIAVCVHGRRDRDDPATVWVGGRDRALRDAICAALSDSMPRQWRCALQ